VAQQFVLRYPELMPVATAVKVEALSKDLGSQRRLAEALGVSPAQVTRWRQGQGIDPLNASRLNVLELVMAELLQQYAASTANKWLYGVNPLLGGRPIDAIRAGRAEALLTVLRQEQAGSYA
jgi:transcriptional regulator with XRE-family HTH domain